MMAWSQSNPAAAVSQVTAVPMHSKTPRQLFPRVKGLPDAAAQGRANKILAGREREDAMSRRDCLREANASIKDLDTYNEQINVRYLSSIFLSVEVRVSNADCGAYPNANVPSPITLDLTTGREVNWERFFVSGFLPPDMGGRSRLGRLYLRRSGLRADDECRTAVEESDYVIWLDSKKHALMVEPDLPHVIRVCAVTIAIPFSEVAPFVVDKSVKLDSAG
ncbi:MAG: hypothetical protein ABI357_04585 [Granulicella sp.]